MSDAQLKAGKHDVHINPSGFTRFSRDSDGGPKVSFVRTSDSALLIMVEGRRVLRRDSFAAQTQTTAVALRYTTAEWDAFIQGVRAGEFEDYAAGPRTDLIPMRDSKDPEGPILIFTAVQMKPFFDAIRAGKYDLASKQGRPGTS